MVSCASTPLRLWGVTGGLAAGWGVPGGMAASGGATGGGATSGGVTGGGSLESAKEAARPALASQPGV